MSPKFTKILFWLTTGLFSALMLMSATMYLSNYEMVKSFFEGFGYPTYLIYPLAFAKIIGIIVLLTRFSPTLKEWAYSAFFVEIILAFLAHYMIDDGGHGTAVIAMLLLLSSYFLQRSPQFSAPNYA